MKKITQENLAEFKPVNQGNLAERIEHYAQKIGVESDPAQRDYSWGLREWNRTSGIGFTDAELDMIELIHSVAKENQRFDNEPFIAAHHGGNTAEHPIFIGLSFDDLKEKAGFSPETFDPASPETLAVAKLSQTVHAMAAIHDVGEMVDISYGEQKLSGASYKEPKEEELVAPFQFKLAAYALSVGKPELFGETIRELKAEALAAKQKYFQEAVDGKITGDEFVQKFGEVIGKSIAGAENAFTESDIKPEYREAVDNLSHLFEQCEKAEGIAGSIFGALDKFEGGTHYGRYAGRGAKEYGANTPETDPQKRMMNRLFGEPVGDSMSFSLMHSSGIVENLQYTMKPIAGMFKELESVPEAERAAAEKLVRSVAAGMVRVVIPMLQKGPAYVDFNADKANEPPVDPVKQGAEESFAQRLGVQRGLNEQALPKLKERKGHVDSVEGVIDTKALIAVVEKTAQAIESGTFTPDGSSKTIFPVGQELPDALKVLPKDLKEAVQKYPLDVASEYRRDQFKGSPVRI